MASNLNRAFVRAYAKDRMQPLPESPNAALPETPRDASRPTAPGASTGTAPSTSSAAAPQQFSPSVNRPTNFPQSAPAPKLISGRAVPTAGVAAPAGAPAVRVVAPKQTFKPAQPAQLALEADAAVAASSVWQRIDTAHVQQPPYVHAPPSRRATSKVEVGNVAGPRHMQAAAAPVAPSNRPGFTAQPQPVDLPLVTESENFLPAGDDGGIETRRRTVADFLYSAGQVPGVSAGARSTAASSSPRTSISQVGETKGRPASGFVSSGVSALGHSTVTEAAASPPMRSQAATAGVTPMPVRTPTREASGVERERPSGIGQILRVDVPGAARSPEPDWRATATVAKHSNIDRVAAAAPPALATAQVTTHATPYVAPNIVTMPGLPTNDVAADVATAGMNASVFQSVVDRWATEQRRVDRAHELNATERQLRRTKHKIFNPVWEVDSLQWPSVCDKLMTHRAESMAQVAAHLKAACDDGLSVLGVTSADNGEGRTTVACCLARLAAAHGLNVVLVDLDLDHPTLCLQANLEIEKDWRDCLSEDVKLEEVAVHSIDDQLTLLPLKPRGDRPGLLASDTRIAEILSELGESFELVIVDASRMHSSGNVISGLAHTQIFDASIIVVDRRNLDQERIEDAVRAVQQTGIESIGLVDNFFNG